MSKCTCGHREWQHNKIFPEAMAEPCNKCACQQFTRVGILDYLKDPKLSS